MVRVFEILKKYTPIWVVAPFFGLFFLLPLVPLLFLLSVPVIYLSTYGSDEMLERSCSEDTVFIRYSLLMNKKEFWEEHIHHLDNQIQHQEELPVKIAKNIAEKQKWLDAALQNRVIVDRRTDAQRYADALRRKADAIEDAERDAQWNAERLERIAQLKACRAAANFQLNAP